MYLQPQYQNVPVNFNRDKAPLITLVSVVAVLLGYLGNIVVTTVYPELLQSIPASMLTIFSLIIAVSFPFALYLQCRQEGFLSSLYTFLLPTLAWLILGFAIGVLQNIGIAWLESVAGWVRVEKKFFEASILLLFLPSVIFSAMRRTPSAQIYWTLFTGYAANIAVNFIDPNFLQQHWVILLIVLSFPLVFYLQLWQQSSEYYRSSQNTSLHLIVGLWYGFVTGLLVSIGSNWLLQDPKNMELIWYKSVLCILAVTLLYAPLAIRYASKNSSNKVLAIIIELCFLQINTLIFNYLHYIESAHIDDAISKDIYLIFFYAIYAFLTLPIIFYLTGAIIIYCSGRKYRGDIIYIFSVTNLLLPLFPGICYYLFVHLVEHGTLPIDNNLNFYKISFFCLLLILGHLIIFICCRLGAVHAAYDRWLFKVIHPIMDRLCGTKGKLRP